MNAKQFPLLLVLFVLGVAKAIDRPRLRPSPYFGNVAGMKYTGIDNLGNHSYNSFFGEKNALLYTSRAGYIDLGHLRESADRTRYLYEVCRKNISKGNTDFAFEVIEPAIYHVHLEYPANWKSIDQLEKDRISREISITLGQHFAHLSTIWHEIVTWYGYASTGLLSEKASSFSWEDGYSDLLGTKVAAMVLRENRQTYDAGMRETIVRELKKLDPQPAQTAQRATAKIKGKWYSGRYPFLKMKKRNFDVGFDDGSIDPFLIPGMFPNAVAIPCEVGSLDSLSRYGFTMSLLMTPKESERRQILNIVYSDRSKTTLKPMEDFPKIVRHIQNEATREQGKYVAKATL